MPAGPNFLLLQPLNSKILARFVVSPLFVFCVTPCRTLSGDAFLPLGED